MPPPLPEDPVAGRRSTAQWQEHLEEEEHERRLGYDRRRLGQHRAVLASLHGLRQRYDRAKTNRAVASASAFCRDRAPELRRRITAIDPWGVSSKLLGDYGAMVDVLTGPYPAALLASIAGDPRQLHELRADWDRRVRKVQDWLAEAAASEDE
jgi:hypothetical protein